MIVPWLTFVAVDLVSYAGFVKLAARLLGYRISWRSIFFFAVIMLVVVIFVHVLDFRQPVATRIGHGVVLLLGLAILKAWFFRSRGTDRNGVLSQNHRSSWDRTVPQHSGYGRSRSEGLVAGHGSNLGRGQDSPHIGRS
jgi:hypothetical protein